MDRRGLLSKAHAHDAINAEAGMPWDLQGHHLISGMRLGAHASLQAHIYAPHRLPLLAPQIPTQSAVSRTEYGTGWIHHASDRQDTIM
jgi:hypothetical protein